MRERDREGGTEKERETTNSSQLSPDNGSVLVRAGLSEPKREQEVNIECVHHNNSQVCVCFNVCM